MTRAQVSTWARRYVVTSASFLVLWQTALLAGVPRRTSVTLGLLGFVFHMLFGKAYSLVPSYFGRQLAVGWAPGVQYPLTVLGTVGLALSPLVSIPRAPVATAGAVLWAAGIAVFVGALAWTIRDNPLGAETATGDHNADRQPVDRVANGFVPVALAYLALGTYALLASHTPIPVLVDGYPPRATHLLAAGTATLLVLAIGFRLPPRFMVSTPPRWLVYIALPAGALGPILLAVSLPTGVLFPAASLLEATAVLAFALAIAVMYRDSDRRRVGFYGGLAGATAGCVGVLLGLHFAFENPAPELVTAHYRLNLLGFLGLTIVGVAYQFYPPNAASVRVADDRTATASIVLLATGVAVQALGLATRVQAIEATGVLLALLGAGTYLALLVALFRDR